MRWLTQRYRPMFAMRFSAELRVAKSCCQHSLLLRVTVRVGYRALNSTVVRSALGTLLVVGNKQVHYFP